MSNADGWRWKRLDLNAAPEPEGTRRARPVYNAPGSSATTDTATVVVLDDDEDVQICSPPRQCNRDESPRHDEEILQLTIGVPDQRPKLAVSRKRNHRQKRVHPATIIDLTASSDDCEVINERPRKKSQASTTKPVEAPPKELKLSCAICFDTMKNETSTVCGHLFCATCIAAAIKAQKRCPTCRKKLTNSMVHRIYLGGS